MIEHAPSTPVVGPELSIQSKSCVAGPPVLPRKEALDECPVCALYFAQQVGQRHSNENEPSGVGRRTSRHPHPIKV